MNLDGHPALIHPSGKEIWQLELGSAQLPQVVEVVISMAEDEASSATLTRSPSLVVGAKPIPVELSLWSFFGTRATGIAQVHEAASVSAADQAALRLDRSISIAESATPLATELSLRDNDSWFVFWMDLLARLRNDARRVAQQSLQGTASQVVPPADDQLTRAVKRLDAWIQQHDQAVAKTGAVQPPADDSQAPAAELTLPISLTAGMQQSHFIADGGSDQLPIQVGPERAAPWQAQALGIFLIVGVAIAGVLVVRSPHAVDFICRWPHALGVLIGVVYWAWLWPSWLGLAIVAFFLLRAVRPSWPGHSARAEGSTVMRTGAKASAIES